MIDFLKSWVFNIITLVIFIVLLEIILPTGKIKKFINLVSGFILIIAIVNPFLGLINNGVNLEALQIADSNFIDRKEIVKNSRLVQEKQMEQVTEVYRKKVINQLQDTLKKTEGISDVKADLIINEDYNSENFGEIKRVYINLVTKVKDKGVTPVTKVEKVEIEKKERRKENNASDMDNPAESELKRSIEDKINKMLGIKSENIVISVVKG